MEENDWLVDRFEANRAHLRSVAYSMLGSLDEADDAVQEAWLRLSRSDTTCVENLGGWLTTVVGRVCLDMLRSRKSRCEEPLEKPPVVHLPDPIVEREDGVEPEERALVADSVGLALLVVLDTLPPAERLAFVLHDVFAVPFEEISAIVARSPAAARQLASRARRSVRGEAIAPDADLARKREVVDAFFAASREDDFEGLLAVLDPGVVIRADYGAAREIRGAQAVAEGALTYSRLVPFTMPALVNGAAGVVTARQGLPFSVMGFTVARGRLVEIDVLSDPARLGRLDLSALDD